MFGDVKVSTVFLFLIPLAAIHFSEYPVLALKLDTLQDM